MRALLLLASGCCSLGSHWSTANTAAELGFAALATVDALQSRNAVEMCSESNPVIGPCGDRVPPVAYYPLSVVVHVAVALTLPARYRTWFQAATVGVEADQVYENHALGYHVDGTWSQPGKIHP